MPQTHRVRPQDLKLDKNNPRAGGAPFENEAEAVAYLIDHADVRELVSSITAAGWIEFEPLIVESGSNIVLEGNRRLAALKLLQDETLRESLNFEIEDGASEKVPKEVSVIKVKDRDAARSYIAFKHINGPAKWDALAKARYADEWVKSGEDIALVSKSIGDTHNTVLRLINGHRVLLQAIAQGFEISDITARRFNFSHLYTAVARPTIRKFLGLSEDLSILLNSDPVEPAYADNLGNLMGWLYGQSRARIEHVVKSQNPDLNTLVRVLGDEEAKSVFLRTGSLRVSSEVVDPPANRFAEALRAAAHSSERALGLVVHFDPTSQGALQGSVRSLAETVKAIRTQMATKLLGDDDL